MTDECIPISIRRNGSLVISDECTLLVKSSVNSTKTNSAKDQ